MKRVLFRWITFAILLAQEPVKGEIVDRIVAVVNDEVITLRQLKLAENSALQSRPRGRDSEVGLSPSDQTKLLEGIIEEKLIAQMADKVGVTVTQEELNTALEEIKKRNNILTDTKLQEVVISEGQTWNQFLDEIRRQIKMVKLINREVRSKVTIDDAEIQDYYENNRSPSQVARQRVRARHILFSVPENADDQTVESARKKAEEVLSQIQGGLDFVEAARLYSDDSSGEQGGDLGVLSKGQMISPLDDVIFDLNPGEVSQPVQSTLGFHLIKVEEKMGGDGTAPESVKEQIRDLLFQKKVETFYKNWIEKVKSEAYIEIKDISQAPKIEDLQ